MPPQESESPAVQVQEQSRPHEPQMQIDENDPFKLVLGLAHSWCSNLCETNEEYAKAMSLLYPIVMQEYATVKVDVQDFVTGKSKKVSGKVRKMMKRFEKTYRGGAYDKDETDRYNEMARENNTGQWVRAGASESVIEMGEKWARKDAKHLSTQISPDPDIRRMIEHSILPYSYERAMPYVQSLTSP